VRRYNFADEGPLVAYLHQYGRSVEMTQQDFFEGQWQDALQAVQRQPLGDRPPPTPTGAEEAAALMTRFLTGP
jgi:hypothetical protein